MPVNNYYIFLPTALALLAADAYAKKIEPSASPEYYSRVNFDTDALKAYGLNSELAEYFAETPRFSPGDHRLTIKLNGKSRGIKEVSIDEKGQLCANESFLRTVGIKAGKDINSAICPYLTDLWPNARVTSITNNNELDLVVPPEVINDTEYMNIVSVAGGKGGMLNYSAFATHSESNGDNADSYYTQLEAGFNADDWIARSSHILSKNSNGDFSFDSLNTYVQKSLTDYGVIFQGGEINASGIQLSMPSLYGIQIMPEYGLAAEQGSGVEVSGIALSSQARVDVKQQGQLIYSSLVPSGPFTLKDIPIKSYNDDLNVTVTESDNSEKSFTVPSATFRGGRLGPARGLSVAMGQAKDMNTRLKQPWILAVSNGWSLGMNKNVTMNVLQADNHYYAASASFNYIPVNFLSTNTTLTAAIDNRTQNDGLKFESDIYYATPFSTTFNVGASFNEEDYRTITDVYTDNPNVSYQKYEYHAGVSFNHSTLGNLSFSWYSDKYWNESNNNQRVVASWSRSFRYAAININWQSNVRNEDNDDDKVFYVGISVPLGHWGSTNNWYRDHDGKASYGTRYSNRLTENSNYTVNYQRDVDSNVDSWGGSLDSNLHYTRLGLSTDTSNIQNKTYSASLAGGIIAHEKGIVFSPYSVNNTFGIISLDKKVSGVEIDTMRGKVWTDFNGKAAIPAIAPWQPDSVNINTQSLPGNMDVINGKAQLVASHGAVADINFPMLSQRRIMFSILMENGSPLPENLNILNADGDYITTSPQPGVVFINDVKPQDKFYAQLEGNQRCVMEYHLPESEPDSFYQELNGTCRVAGGGL